MADFNSLITPKDMRVVNKAVFDWLETNIVNTEVFCGYLGRIQYSYDLQCGAAVDYMCENILKNGNSEQVISEFVVQVLEGKTSLYLLMAMALDLNKNINIFLTNLLDEYGAKILNGALLSDKFLKLLWNPHFLSHPSIHTILKYNPALMMSMMSQWDEEEHSKRLRVLHKFGVLNAKALTSYLDCLTVNGGERALIHQWDTLFPTYTQQHVVEIARALPTKIFEEFIVEKHVDVEKIVPVLSMWQEKSLDLNHPRARELFDAVEWDVERFEDLFHQSVTLRLEQGLETYAAHLDVFINFWLTNASEQNWHYIDPYVRNSGVVFGTETQALIEHMNIFNAVGDSGVHNCKRKL